jgi:hypothetical protein
VPSSPPLRGDVFKVTVGSGVPLVAVGVRASDGVGKVVVSLRTLKLENAAAESVA